MQVETKTVAYNARLLPESWAPSGSLGRGSSPSMYGLSPPVYATEIAYCIQW